MKKLEDLEFDNTYARLGREYFSPVLPEPARDPYLVAFNPAAARLIGLDPAEAARPEFLQYFSGARALPRSEPLAMVYSGHQFGVRVPRLGDGRAILLGEALGPDGRRWDLHLKGSGQTPYSRNGDGRAVLRSCIREYLCGEAMEGLGIPTTRSLCIVGSPDLVFRETVETRALLVRMAPSHVRFGSFEYFYFHHRHEPEVQRQLLRRLADYVIREHFPGIGHAEGQAEPERYGALLKEVALRTARLIARWQAVGWAHGVMNTDNLSILGITLDYGPYGFMDEFDFGFIPNHSDDTGRYAFSEQPKIGLWNLNVLGQVLLPLTTPEIVVAALREYEPEFHREYARWMRLKLGLLEERPDGDQELVRRLFAGMRESRADYTVFFRGLGRGETDTAQASEEMAAWTRLYRERLKAEGQDGGDQSVAREERMNRVNPKFVLRNYLAQQAIEKAQKGDFSEIEILCELLKTPFDEHPAMEDYARRPPDWGRHLVVSCSS